MQIKRNKSIQYLGLEDGKQVVGDAWVGRFHRCCHQLDFLADVAPGASVNSWEGSYADLRGLGAEPCRHPSCGHRRQGRPRTPSFLIYKRGDTAQVKVLSAVGRRHRGRLYPSGRAMQKRVRGEQSSFCEHWETVFTFQLCQYDLALSVSLYMYKQYITMLPFLLEISKYKDCKPNRCNKSFR